MSDKQVFMPHDGCEECKIEADLHKPDWEIVLETINPVKYNGYNRPRRTSLHTLAFICGRKDPIALAEEMAASKKVLGYICPDVCTPIFYLERLAKLPGMIDTRDARVWGEWGRTIAGATSIKDFVEKNPYPKVKGFKRFAQGHWTGGGYGMGSYVAGNSGMSVPYEPDDYPYARAVIKALKDAGYTPAIEDPENIPPDPVVIAEVNVPVAPEVQQSL